MRGFERALLTVLLCALPAAAAATEEPPRRAVIISIDGLKPDDYLRADELGLEVPNLRRLMREGAWARGVVGVLPSVTYPSHTTLITGVAPRVHGITSNRVLDPEGLSAEAWHWYAREVRVPTLVSAAAGRWLTTAAVSWPVSVGLPADLNLPEVWRNDSSHPTDLNLLAALSTPRLLEAVGAWRGRPFPYPLSDEDRTDTALYAIALHRPHLLLLHIFDLDYAAHAHGPFSAETLAAVEESDRQVGRVLAALEAAGLAESTLVAVVSDHGFVPISRRIKPNVILRRAGLLEVDEEGGVTTWRAYFQADGGSAGLYLHDPGDTAAVARVRELFTPLVADPEAGVREILGPGRIAELGGSAEAALFLDAREGFAFSGEHDGEWSEPSEDRGYHGHAPDRPELYAALVLSAPGLGSRGDLGVVPMTSIAPTVARYLGLQLAPEAGDPLPLFSPP